MEPSTGKTFADLLDLILTSPRRWLSLLVFLVATSAAVIAVVYACIHLLSVQPKEVELGSKDSHIIFQSVMDQGRIEYLVVVNPQGWQKTAIEVHTGDRLSFYADGKIAIDASEIIAKSNARLEYEDAIAKKYNIRRDDPTEMRTPEDFFTPEQKRSLILNRPWIGPGGFSLDQYQPTFRSRRAHYLLPAENAAALVAAIKGGTDDEPSRSDAFFVGRVKEDYTPRQSGSLWFTVNDAQSPDPANPRLFYNDNVGVFWVRVTVHHAPSEK